MVVIDSIAALFRAEYGIDQTIQRAVILQTCAAQLKYLSWNYNVAIVCVNQVHILVWLVYVVQHNKTPV